MPRSTPSRMASSVHYMKSLAPSCAKFHHPLMRQGQRASSLRKKDDKNEEGWGYPVGAGVVWMWSGDACVAPAGGGRRSRDEGDAQHKAQSISKKRASRFVILRAAKDLCPARDPSSASFDLQNVFFEMD